MKRLYILFFAAAFNLFGEAFTLTDCIKIARRHNNKVEMAQAQILFARAQKRQNLSALLPHFTVEGRYELKNKGQDYSVFTEFGSSFSTKTIGVNSTFLLFDFFSAWNNYKANQIGESVSRKNLEKVFLELDKEVALAYIKVLENQTMLEVLEDLIKNLRTRLETVEKSLKEGILSKTDALNVKLLIAEQKRNLLKASSEVLLSKMNLNHLLGKDPLSILEVINNFDSYPKYSLEKLRKTALANNLDIKILKEKIGALNYSIKSLSKKNAPNFFLFGSYYHLEDTPPSSSLKNKNDRNWVSGGMGMKFPLYDGGSNLAETKKVKSTLNKTKIELDELVKTVVMEATANYLKCDELEKKIVLEDEIIQIRKDNLDSLNEKYVRGLVSVDAILSAQKDLTDAKLNKNKSVFNFHANCAIITALIGKN